MGEHCRVVIAINLKSEFVFVFVFVFVYEDNLYMNGRTLPSCHCNQPEVGDVGKCLVWTFYLNSCITVVRRDYSVLNKDKIDWTARPPPVNRELYVMVFKKIFSLSCIVCSFFFSFPNYVYVCIGLGSGLVNKDMVGPKSKFLRGCRIQYETSQQTVRHIFFPKLIDTLHFQKVKVWFGFVRC